MQYFLIHGYGKALDIQEPNIPANGGFYIFDTEISNQQAYPYIWAEEIKRNRFTPYNLIIQLQLYYKERAKSQDSKECQKLNYQLSKYNPKTIIAHSSGARLLVNYLVDYKLPSSVQNIIFVQADISRRELDSAKISSKINFINFWCWWDPALITSTLLNRCIPIGLYSSQLPQAKFYPLHHLPNPHQDIWRDHKFKQVIEDIL
ncbi:MAG: hypothetical protein WD512_20155 [Candidatus Paceibacterota bacterium]